MNNIAEDFERESDADFARFLGVSKASCGEVRSMYYIAEDLGYIASQLADVRRAKARHISAGLAKLMSHLNESRGKSKSPIVEESKG